MTNPKILVLGVTGMLGHKMLQVLGVQYENVFGTMRGSLSDPRYSVIPQLVPGRVLEGLDLGDAETVSRTIADLRPDVVVKWR